MDKISRKTINELLNFNLDIPSYQRPYMWDTKNIIYLLKDIEHAITDYNKYGENFKYRLGTIILYEDNNKKDTYDIVDGQQRIISLILIKLCLDHNFTHPILQREFTSKISRSNIHINYTLISEYLTLMDNKDKFKTAFEKILESVVICVTKIAEAFQLFDSQNTRGRALNPHDLLKAYHLREMKDYPYEMEHAVQKWEAKEPSIIKDLFNLYLFPSLNWSRGIKSKSFTIKDIDIYKGISESSNYTYAKRASKAMPYFQITEPFISGSDFFTMVDYYLQMLDDIKKEFSRNTNFSTIQNLLPTEKSPQNYKSTGYKYATDLFYCAVLCYYDKFHNFDEMAIKKLFAWSFMLRIDMNSLGFDSINNYAIGNGNKKYTNNIPIFTKIISARIHDEISSLQIQIKMNEENKKWEDLYKKIESLWR